MLSYRTGLIVSELVNIFKDNKKQPKRFTPFDYFPLDILKSKLSTEERANIDLTSGEKTALFMWNKGGKYKESCLKNYPKFVESLKEKGFING